MSTDNSTHSDSLFVSPFDWWGAALNAHQIATEKITRNSDTPLVADSLDPLGLIEPYQTLLNHWSSQPLEAAARVNDFVQSNSQLQWNMMQRLFGGEIEPVVEPSHHDRRFRDDEWTDNPWYDYIKQAYLLFGSFVIDCFEEDAGLSAADAEKLNFFVRHWLDAMAPTNFPMSNPEVIREAVRTNGASLLQGYKNYLRDWEQSDGPFRITLSDPDAFELGKNIATTPGKVVFENDYIQLIQYLPTTEKTLQEPLLVIPPWINKYYIMDLRPENSLLKYWVDQGHTVFVISWVNPDQSYASSTFEDYLLKGAYAAVEAVEKATGQSKINAVGYCIGGTLLATMLAHMAASGDERINTATFLTTLIDFSDPGEIRAFIDEQQIRNLEAQMEKKGYLEGSAMASAFSMLRANELIWNAVVQYYLMGRETIAFDLLHWNADSTRMPSAMHSYYLRNMYLENLLSKPGGIKLAGKALNIGDINIPVYFLSTDDDHIAPWRTTYIGAALCSGPVRFVLGGSGHIAGVINPPNREKYGYEVNENQKVSSASADDWRSGATQHSGSWWPDWKKWIGQYSTQTVDAPSPGKGGLAVIEDAPGRYAAHRID